MKKLISTAKITGYVAIVVALSILAIHLALEYKEIDVVGIVDNGENEYYVVYKDAEGFLKLNRINSYDVIVNNNVKEPIIRKTSFDKYQIELNKDDNIEKPYNLVKWWNSLDY